MRQIPSELAQRYKDDGWWTDETVGELIGRGLADRGDLAFEVHSATHPYVGTFADVEQIARRLAAGLADRGVGRGRRGRLPVAELDGSSRDVLGDLAPRRGHNRVYGMRGLLALADRCGAWSII